MPTAKILEVALRDASARLDRAKRLLPSTTESPVIFKRDPSQIPMAEFVISSALQDPVSLCSWVDYVLRNWFINLPGIAAAEVGGELVREIQVVADQEHLAGLGLDVLNLDATLQEQNVETPGGRLLMSCGEISGRTARRFRSVKEIVNLPVRPRELNGTFSILYLGEVAQIILPSAPPSSPRWWSP